MQYMHKTAGFAGFINSSTGLGTIVTEGRIAIT